MNQRTDVAADNPDGSDIVSAQQQGLVEFAIERIFLKDMSFEVPQGAASFRKQWQPRMTQDVLTNVSKIDDERFEVVLRVTVSVKEQDETAYLVEVHQAGVFRIKGLSGNQLAQLLNSHCATILFPYAREAIDSVVTKGSFPPPTLPPINFEALFQQAIRETRAGAAQGARGDGGADKTH